MQNARDSPKRRKQKYRPRPLTHTEKCKIVGLPLNHEEPEPERKVRSPENDEGTAFRISEEPSRLLGDAEWEILKARSDEPPSQGDPSRFCENRPPNQHSRLSSPNHRKG